MRSCLISLLERYRPRDVMAEIPIMRLADEEWEINRYTRPCPPVEPSNALCILGCPRRAQAPTVFSVSFLTS